MASKLKSIENEDNVMGASALIEISAMARVGMLSAGAGLTVKRADQMERDAKRLARRGKLDRASQLQEAAVNLRGLQDSIFVQKEQEQIRQLLPNKDEVIVQGRATEKGRGKAGLRVSLVDTEGTVLAQTKSARNGAFVIRPAAPPDADARIIIEDADGVILGEMPAPVLALAKVAFVPVPVEKLNITPVRPKEPGVNPKPTPDRPDDELVVVPKLVGRKFESAGRAANKVLSLGEVKVVRDPGKAGKIIEQMPAPNDRVAKETPVMLVVAAGDPQIDAETARLMVRYDPRVVAMNIPTRAMTKAQQQLGMDTLAGLEAMRQRPIGDIATALPGRNIEHAKTLQIVAQDVAAKFERM